MFLDLGEYSTECFFDYVGDALRNSAGFIFA
jgi:hypothetical protein